MNYAAIISIGRELLTGDIPNSNATYLAAFVRRFGYLTRRIIMVDDDETEIIQALDSLRPEEKLVFITGGLGPTSDDVTRPVLARYFKAQLVFREDIYQKIAAVFEKRGIKMPENNRVQAYFPDNAELLPNIVGSAPGMKFSRDERLYYVLPGVPREMEAMLEEIIAPQLQNSSEPLTERLYHFVGMPESLLYERLRNWMEQHPEMSFSFRPRDTQIDLAVLLPALEAAKMLTAFEIHLKEQVGSTLYGSGEDTLESVIANLLVKHSLTIATAESCTGGLIAHRITNVPGSSLYFKMGVVAYSNAAKVKLLGVREATIKKYGAVSNATAEEMAMGIRQLAETDIGLSSTGIAGPSGGSAAKPVGLLYVGLAWDDKVQSYKFQYRRDRLVNKAFFAQAALNQLRLALLNSILHKKIKV